MEFVLSEQILGPNVVLSELIFHHSDLIPATIIWVIKQRITVVQSEAEEHVTPNRQACCSLRHWSYETLSWLYEVSYFPCFDSDFFLRSNFLVRVKVQKVTKVSIHGRGEKSCH